MTTPRRSTRTQIVIFTLYGEYLVPRGAEAPTSALLTLLRHLGVSERAARSTLSRMSQKGWLASRREGRRSHYRVTDRGRRVVRGGEVRIFEPRRTSWDGRWHMVVYSIPEGKRRLRARLRARLGWLGFGRLAPGTWVSPNDRQAEVEEELDDLGARPYATSFSEMRLHLMTDVDVVGRCWDLPGLNREYIRFLKRYQADFEKARSGNPLSPAECFRRRFWMTFDYASFPRRDPNLPTPLLPDAWQGTHAADVFLGYHRLLRGPSERFVDEVLAEHAAERSGA